MGTSWAHTGTAIIASFLASLVEFVEALTIVLAVGSVRGWRSALAGSASAIVVLLIIVGVLGTALTRIPLQAIQLAIGTLLLLFGLRWLRKAILRSAGLIPLHNEQAAFAKSSQAMHRLASSSGAWDKIAFSATFNITMLEGTEVVFIVIAIGAGRAGMLLPASLGAVAALFVVAALGLVVHRPLARVPENTLKFTVGVMLSAFGTFWVGEGLKLEWPGDDWSIPVLIAAYLILAIATVPLCRSRSQAVTSNT